MKRSNFSTILNKLLFIVTTLVLLPSYKTPGPIVLSDEPLSLKPATFYIAGVTDERDDKSALAVLVNKGPANKLITRAADLEGGVAVAINRFIERNLPQNKYFRPVVMRIKAFKLIEAPLADGSVDGRVKLSLSFGLEKDYGTEHLIDYNGGLHYIRSAGNTAVIEQQLRNSLKLSLVYFNDWMNANVNTSRKLAQNVNISFTDYTEYPEGDTIYYSAKRPLSWADFQSDVKPEGMVQAQVMPSIGYAEQAGISNGTIKVTISMKAYLPKSAAWANYTGRDAYALNHEQRHFDIVKIIAEQFKQKVLAEKLTPDTFEAFVNMQYLDSFRDMNVMQKAYDKETSHGLNTAAQAEWNGRIDKELEKYTIKASPYN